jgi:hypothetical protein
VNNTIDAQVIFSYKGETYNYSAHYDLDQMMSSHGALPNFHLALAREHKVDSYSYLYEVMMAHEVEFSNAEGLASGCLDGTYFDVATFEKLWCEQKEYRVLQEIAVRLLQIEDLENAPEMKAALLEAYAAGKSMG